MAHFYCYKWREHHYLDKVVGFGLEQNFSLFFRFDYDRKLLETAIQNEIQMKEIMKTFNTALQGIKGKYNS